MKPSEISEKDFDHFKKSCKISKSITLADFTRFYVEGDIFQLADVLENTIDAFIGLFGLDLSYYISAPYYFNDAMLKVTGVEIPLITDPDMHLFFEDENEVECLWQ